MRSPALVSVAAPEYQNVYSDFTTYVTCAFCPRLILQRPSVLLSEGSSTELTAIEQAVIPQNDRQAGLHIKLSGPALTERIQSRLLVSYYR